jgi:hypothetical protein
MVRKLLLKSKLTLIPDLLTKEFPVEEKKFEWKGTTVNNVVCSKIAFLNTLTLFKRLLKPTLSKKETELLLELSLLATNTSLTV